MKKWFSELDDLLRGRKSQADQLALGAGHLPVARFLLTALVLGVLYGMFMGLFSVLNPPEGMAEASWYHQPQLLSSAVKVPLLFLLTLVVTFPSLYVFSALLGVRTNICDMFRLMISAITVNMAVLASLGFITAFFTLTTRSNPFMKLLNVFCFAVAGLISLGFLYKLVLRLEAAHLPAPVAPPIRTGDPQPPPPARAEPPAAGSQAQAAWPAERASAPITDRSRPMQPSMGVFKMWMVIYALVGAQMSWVLRPFVGSPNMEFAWLRDIQSNFFVDVLRTVGELLK